MRAGEEKHGMRTTHRKSTSYLEQLTYYTNLWHFCKYTPNVTYHHWCILSVNCFLDPLDVIFQSLNFFLSLERKKINFSKYKKLISQL